MRTKKISFPNVFRKEIDCLVFDLQEIFCGNFEETAGFGVIHQPKAGFCLFDNLYQVVVDNCSH